MNRCRRSRPRRVSVTVSVVGGDPADQFVQVLFQVTVAPLGAGLGGRGWGHTRLLKDRRN